MATKAKRKSAEGAGIVGRQTDKVIDLLLAVVPVMGQQSAATKTVVGLRQNWSKQFVEAAIVAGTVTVWKAACTEIERRIRTNVNGLAADMKAPKAKREKDSSAVTYNLPTIWRVAKEGINVAFRTKTPFTATDKDGKVTQRSFNKIRGEAKEANADKAIAEIEKKDPSKAAHLRLEAAIGELNARCKRLKPEHIQPMMDAVKALYANAETMLMETTVQAPDAKPKAAPRASTRAAEAVAAAA